MKILLVIPNRNSRAILPAPSIGLAYVATACESAGAEVKILDCHLNNIEPQNITKYLDGIDMVGFQCLSIDIAKVLEYCAHVKEYDHRIITIIGGHHPSAMAHELTRYGEIDHIIVGEGEKPMISLINGKEPIPALIDDLDSLSFPSWKLFELEKYPQLPGPGGRFLPIITSRGCPGKCTFCNSPAMHGDKIRYRSPENVIEEMEWLIKSFPIDRISVFDDNFAFDKNHVLGICLLFKTKNLKIKIDVPQGIRVDIRTIFPLIALREIGCDYMGIGIESGEQRILDAMKKGTTIEKIEETVGKIKRYTNIKLMGFFIIGHPEETEEDILKTIRFSLKLPLDYATFTIFTPFPGTELYDQMSKWKGFSITDWEDLILDKPTFEHSYLTYKRLKELQKLAYRKFYFRPSKIGFFLRTLKEGSTSSYLRRGISILKN